MNSFVYPAGEGFVYPAGEGFIVRIDWSQTDQVIVFVKGSKTAEEAVAEVKKGCNCPRIYINGHIDRIVEINS